MTIDPRNIENYQAASGEVLRQDPNFVGWLLRLADQFKQLADTLFTLNNLAVYDPGNLADGAGVTTTVSVPGCMMGDIVRASFSLDLQGILLSAWVSVAGTVSVRFQNETGGAIDLASGTLRVKVEKVL